MNERVKKEALSIAGGLFSWNAPYRIGYLFCVNERGNEIGMGMFCDSIDEIDPERWDYFLSANRGVFYDIRKPRSLKMLLKERRDLCAKAIQAQA